MITTTIGDSIGVLIWAFGLLMPVFLFAIYFVVEAIHFYRLDSRRSRAARTMRRMPDGSVTYTSEGEINRAA